MSPYPNPKTHEMERKDWIFLAVTTTIIMLIVIILSMVNEYIVDKSSGALGFYLTLVGTALTLIALVFSIYQQIQIKTKSKQIEERTFKFENDLRNNLFGWNINRAIWLTNKLYDSIKDSKKETSLYITREIRAILAECNVASDIYYNNKLTDELCCLKENECTKETVEQLIEKCKKECNQEMSQKIYEHTKKLSGILVALESLKDKNFDPKEAIRINKKVYEVHDYLNKIKPDIVSLSKTS